ncbi:putative 3-deoxy-7-phosphoheptulonate synthase [Lupinus albus]|uniref:Phospho-2-dehydro-3-deoxyheptonate aldolase n=1 Tax=Lupinus albus TaxID=3870 RepID=A0A6A4MVK0_LUPAL|nr:putative 3-deoxy-7-phosphoheptulonate synthase [Lupinus albus]
MTVTTSNSFIPTKSLTSLTHSLFPSSKSNQASFLIKPNPVPYIQAVHAAGEPSTPSTTTATRHAKWAIDSWKFKKALQLPEYPNKEAHNSVLKTLEAFPPIVFAGEAKNLQKRLREAALGNAFILQGGDCADSFKEFNAINIRDTFRILLQMSVVMMFGGQMPVIKVGRMAGQFAKPRSNQFEEKNEWCEIAKLSRR